MSRQLTLYVQRGCLFSEEAIAWLLARGIRFLERDIDSDPDALHDLERLKTIVTSTILVENEIIYGFDEERLASLLNGRETIVDSPDATAAPAGQASPGGQGASRFLG